MESIHTNDEYEKEYKEQFRHMTDEQTEKHIGLEKVRNIIEGFDENYGIDKIRKIVKEMKQEKDEADRKERWNVTMNYVMENGVTEDGRIYTAKLKRWCPTKSISITKELLECEKQN